MARKLPAAAAPYRFKKGGCGNPGGRPKDFLGLRALARSHAPDAIETLVKIMSGRFPAAARVQAATALLDRGYGKPQQHLDVELRDEAVRVLAGTEFDERIIKVVGGLGRRPDGTSLVLEVPATRKIERHIGEDNSDDEDQPGVSFRSMMAELKEDFAAVKSPDRLGGYRDQDDPPIEPP